MATCFVQHAKSVKRYKLDLIKDRIVNHRFVPKTLELSIVDWGDKIDLDFSFDNLNRTYNFNRYDSVSDAKRNYEKIAKANKEGKLYVHVYAEGKARLIIE